MSALPTWLTALQRVREHHRDAALQSLAQNLRATAIIRDAMANVVAVDSQIRNSQQQSSLGGLLDADRLRQLRQDRDGLQSQLAELRQRQFEADKSVLEAQTIAAANETDVAVLRQLADRLLTAQRHEQRRQLEQSTLEAALSLCNGGLGD